MNRCPSALWLALPAAVVVPSLPAAAQVFLTEAQALQAVFGERIAVHREEKILTPADRKKLQESSGLRFPESSYTFLVAEREGKLAGYALVMDEIGKSEPITFLVAMNPEAKVTDVVVMVFRESRGAEVREKRFVRQFRGKTASDPIRVNQDIVNYTGATLSSKALARGVKRALLLLVHFYPEPTRRPLPPNGHLVRPAWPAATSVRGRLALYRQTRYLMGTLCEIRLWADSSPQAARAFAAGFAELHRLDQVFSNYRPDSELSRVNQEAADGPVAVSEEFWQLTRYAVRSWHHTGGTFDITVGPLLKAWGFWGRQPRVPTTSDLAEALARVGSDKFELDPRGRTVRLRQPGMELDFGGLAKGYAAQRAARLLRKQGIAAAVVNLGGSSLYALGRPPRAGDCDEPNWVIAVADPMTPARSMVFFELEDEWAVSTSGTYENCFEAGGRMFSHLLDPRSGQPLSGQRSATVIARSGRRAEVLSKQLLFAAGGHGQALPRALRRTDLVLLEGAPGRPLSVGHHFRSTSLLVPLASKG